jgi:hypothetical protein
MHPFFTSMAIPPTKAYRDDLRNGWHVVPEDVRYVGVSGAVEGQRCAPFSCGYNAARAATRLNAGSESASLIAWHVPEWSKLDDDIGSVLYLHDLKDHRTRKADNITIVMGDNFAGTSPRYAARKARDAARPLLKGEPPDGVHRWSPMVLGRGHGCTCGHECTDEFIAGVDHHLLAIDTKQFKPDCRDALYNYVQASRGPTSNAPLPDPSPPRFTVRPASEMREGEPCRPYTQDDVDHDIEARDRRWLSKNPEEWRRLCDGWGRSLWGKRGGLTFVSAMVDTSSPEWQAFDKEHRKQARMIKGEPMEGCWTDEWTAG